MTSPCIFLIDDHPMFRTGLRMVLEAGLGGARLHEMASIEEALRASAQPDLLLVDIFLSGLDGLSGLPLLLGRWPQVSVVMVASDASNQTMQRALERGARAFLSKATPPQQLLDTLRLVLSHRPATAPPAARTATDAAPHRPPDPQPAPAPGAAAQAASDAAGAPRPGEPEQPLSQRQQQILELLEQGLSNRVIAQRLHLSEHTVRWHVHAILGALAASSRSEAVFMARQRGWLA